MPHVWAKALSGSFDLHSARKLASRGAQDDTKRRLLPNETASLVKTQRRGRGALDDAGSVERALESEAGAFVALELQIGFAA